MFARTPSPTWRRTAALGAAAVWAHQGLWCKVLGRDPSHRDVLATVPGIGPRRAAPAAAALGAAETALALVVARHGDNRRVAALQTGLLAAFNVGGLALGRAHIAHPARMLARNGLVLIVVWSAVDGRRPR
jgi:hypothetical protein